MAVVNITIAERISSAPAGVVLVCNNPTDTIEFAFDDEWSEYDVKTARFSWANNFIDVPFSGWSVKVPEITNTQYVFVGVYANGIASTPIKLDCKRSILCLGDHEYVPPEHTYWDEFAETLAALNKAAEDANNAANKAENVVEELAVLGDDVSAATVRANTAAEGAEAARDNIQADLEQLSEEIGDHSDILHMLCGGEGLEEFEWIENEYVNTDRNGECTAYTGWKRTDYVPIGEELRLKSTSTSTTQVYNAFYDADKKYIGKFLSSTDEPITVPANARYYALSTSMTQNVQRLTMVYSLEKARKNLAITPNVNAQSYTWRGDMVANAVHDTGLGYAVKIGYKAGLSAALGSNFDKITFQFDEYSPNQIIVDAANVTIKSRFKNNVVLPHGVTISGDVAVNIHADNPATAKIIVTSRGVQNTVEGELSISSYETFKVINGSTALTNVIFTMGCGTINRKLWFFGDSYFGMTNSARWPYYVHQNGYTKNALFCGSTGSGQTEGALWLTSLLTMGKPKTIVWCLGMNYNSDGDTAASGWENQVLELATMCNEQGIELILATIPTVPSKNHEQKNTYVRNSGHRYIDFARAVGAQSNGTWYDGMLSSDAVHPAVPGAIALYNAAIAAVPELAYD